MTDILFTLLYFTLLEHAVLMQNKNHKAEIAEIKETYKAEIAEINARITEQDKRHLAELHQRDEIIMEKDQMILHQEERIAELSRLVTKLDAEKKKIVATAAKLEPKQTVAATTAANLDVGKGDAAPLSSAAVVSSAALSLSSVAPENKLKSTPRKIAKTMARPSSVKRNMSKSPENGKASQPSKKDKKDSGSPGKTVETASISPSKSNTQSDTLKSANISPRKSPSPTRRRNTSRSRSLGRWKGESPRSSHITLKTVPPPEIEASPGGDAKPNPL